MSARWWAMVAAIGIAAWVRRAEAEPDDLLAPRLQTLDDSLTRATQLLDQAKVFQDQLALAQSLYVSERCAGGGCASERAVQLIADAQYAGHASRDLLQSARAEVDRAVQFAASSTVSPLLDSARRSRLDDVQRRAETAVRSWLVRRAWYEERMQAQAARSKSQLASACARDPSTVAAERTE